MQTFEIKNRWTGVAVFSIEADSMRACVIRAVESDANLRDADLSGSNLSDADLRDANLRGTDLSDADLSGSNLRGSNLSDANLRDADLSGSNLRGTNLRGTNLRGTNLSDADLRDANLRGTDLRGTNLRGSNLSGTNLRGTNLRGSNLPEQYKILCRDDLWAVLSAAPKEVDGLRLALAEGRVDGSTYTGTCACLVGTIANVRGVDHHSMSLLQPNSSRPIERFFLAIREGDTPDTNEFSKLALCWCDEWLTNMRGAFGAQP